jgi:Sigma-70 factor, region 1.2
LVSQVAAWSFAVGDSSLTRYLEEIRRFPMLEPQDEYMLAKRWREHGDRDAAHKLVTSHLDRHVLVFDIPGVFEALAKCAQTIRLRVKRCWVKEPHHWHCRVLLPTTAGHAVAAPSSVMNSRRLIR